MKENRLEYRMYFFVPYNISDIQKGIQAGHCVEQYALKYFNDPTYKDYLINDRTWIILNGGTTNNKRDFDGNSIGTLNQIYDQLNDMHIKCAHFTEPDLNDALSAICFLADERVWSEEYDNFDEFVLKNSSVDVFLHLENKEEWKEKYKEYLGGDKNVFLRELISNKKLA